MARKTLTRQGSMVGVSPTLNCSTSEQVYDVVYVSGTDTVARTDASNASKVDAVGWIISKPTTTTCHISAQPGPVSGATGLVAGQPVYLSAVTPGAVTSTAPAIDVQVGSATSATTWVFYKDLRATSLGDLTSDVTSSDIDAGSRTISAVTTPSAADQATNKGYVDSVAMGKTGSLSMAGPIKSFTIETATNIIDIYGLDFEADGEYEMYARVHNEASVSTNYFIYVGAPTLDETPTNYNASRVQNGTLYSYNAPYWANVSQVATDGNVFAHVRMSQDVSGRFRLTSDTNQDVVPVISDYVIRSVNVFGSITRVRLKADQPNGFGVGTTIRVFKIGNSVSTASSIEPLDIKRAASGFDDEFDTTVLDTSWTVVSGVPGTVVFGGNGAAGAGAVYDLSTRPGQLLIQGQGTSEQLKLRKDYTIAVNECVVLSMAMSAFLQGGGDHYRAGISINDSDTSHQSGNGISMYAVEDDGSNFALEISGFGSYSSVLVQNTLTTYMGEKIFLRVSRQVSNYIFSWSLDGTAWAEGTVVSVGDVASNVWLFSDPSVAITGSVGIHAIDWIRLGDGSTLDPWPLVSGSSTQAVAVGEWRGARAYRTADLALTGATTTPISWQAAARDTDGFCGIGGANPERMTIPASVSKIRLRAHAEFLNVDGDCQLYIYKNGSPLIITSDNATAGADYVSVESPVLDVIAGDYFVASVWVADAGQLTCTTSDTQTWLELEVVEPIVAITDKGSVNISSANSPYTMPTTKKTVYVTADGAITINLPALAGNDGMEVEVKIISGAYSVTIDPSGSETVDGGLTYSFSLPGECRTFKAKGLNGNLGWYMVARASIEPGNLTMFTCTSTEAVGNLVYVSAASTVSQADSDAAGTSDAIGWIYHKPTTTTCLVADGLGPITSSGLTAGSPVYLSGTAGEVSPTPGTVSVKVGVAVSATSFIFQRPLPAASVTPVPTAYTGDKALVATAVTGDETYSGVDITETPFSDGYVQVLLNGMQVELGNGVKTKDCYFSGDSGSTARAISAITAGDGLYWNAVISGVALDSLDEFDLNYLVTAA